MDSKTLFKRIRGQLTQAEFAGELGVDPSLISHIEAGRAVPSGKVLEVLVRKYPHWCREIVPIALAWRGGR